MKNGEVMQTFAINSGSYPNTLRQMKPAHYEIDHLIKNKSRILQRILKECELWRAKEWKQVEKMTFRFFERINVFRDYRLQYMIVPEVRQFLPVTFLRDNDSLDGLHPSAAWVHAIAEAVCRKINENIKL